MKIHKTQIITIDFNCFTNLFFRNVCNLLFVIVSSNRVSKAPRGGVDPMY